MTAIFNLVYRICPYNSRPSVIVSFHFAVFCGCSSQQLIGLIGISVLLMAITVTVLVELWVCLADTDSYIQTWIQDLLIQDQDQDSAVSRPRPRPRLAYPRPRPRPRLRCPRPRPRPRLKTSVSYTHLTLPTILRV